MSCVYFSITLWLTQFNGKNTKSQVSLPFEMRLVRILLGLGWLHFFYDDPARGVPTSVRVPSRVSRTGTHIQRHCYSAPGDPSTVALNGSRAKDVPNGASVHRRVNWHGALQAVESKEPSITGSCSIDPLISLINNFEMCIALLLDK